MSTSILKYFRRDLTLPNPSGPLSKVVPPDGIKAANEEVRKTMKCAKLAVGDTRDNSNQQSLSRGPYERFTPEEKALIGKRAAECGVAAATRYCSKRYHGRLVKESSVRTWRNKYRNELELKRKAKEEESPVVEKLVDKKRGRPFLLGDELDQQVRAYLLNLRESATVVNTAIAIGCAQGLVKHYDSNLLECNGGSIVLTKSWAKSLLQRMGFVKGEQVVKVKCLQQIFKF